jgi:4-amino-4-deoxy-L-arabinose transferase-like glycosyltransferase
MKFSSKKKNNNSLGFPIFAWVILPLVLFFSFGYFHLTKFETADEHYWLYSNTVQGNYWQMNNGRIHQYWEAISNGNLAETRINDKPGIMLAYVSGIGAYLKTNLDAAVLSGKHAPMNKIDKAELVNLYFRLPQLIFLGLFSLLIFYLLRKLFENKWIAIFSTSFILLSPALIGISQIINPDSLLWAFGFAAILSYFIHLKSKSKKYALLAGLFFGLCLLTKYTSVVLIPFFMLAMISYILENNDEKNEDFSRSVLFYGLSFYGAIALGLLLYAIILPDNLISLDHFLKGSIGLKGSFGYFLAVFLFNAFLLVDAKFFKSYVFKKVFVISKNIQFFSKYLLAIILLGIFLVVLFDVIIFKDFFGFFAIEFDASVKQFFALGFTWKVFIRQMLPLIFSLSPMVIIFVITAWVLSLMGKLNKQNNWIVFISSVFIVVFVAASTLQKVPLSMRYSIMLYPIIFTLAAISLAEIVNIFAKRKRCYWFIYGLVLFFGFASLWQVKPFYFNYTNILLPEKYIIADAWGYGGYEAAIFLNQLENGRNIRIWSDYNGVCVFYNGDCVANKLTMQNILRDQEDAGKSLPKFGYFVSSRRGYNTARSLWDNLNMKYASEKIYSSKIGNSKLNFLNIYKNN